MRSRRLTLLAALAGSSAVATLVVCAALTASSALRAAGLPAGVAASPSARPTASPAAAEARTARHAVTPVAPRTVARPAAAAPAPAPVVVAPVASETPAEHGARVLASLGYDWRPLGYRIRFLPARDGLLGLTNPSRRLVEVYVKDGESDLVLAHSIAHELGHVVDAVRGTPARRASYLRVRGLDRQAAWFGCPRCTDYATPAGDWAEVFAAWLAGPGDFRSELAGAPSDAQLQELAPLFTP